MKQPIENRLSVRGRVVSYLSFQNAPECPWLICFSGAGSDSFDWLAVQEEISEFANILIVDKPGFLSTDSYTEVLSQDQIARDVEEVCSELLITKAHLLGHSLGYLSALVFAIQSKDSVETLSITSLDGISFNPLSIEVLKRMAPSGFIFDKVVSRLLSKGFFTLTPKKKDYPSGYFNHADKFYLRGVFKRRRTRRHNRSVWVESIMTPKWCEVYSADSNIKSVLASIPQHCLQAVEVSRPFDEQPEVKFFPQLRQLFWDELQEKIDWCKHISVHSGGYYQSIDSEHFIQWHYPMEVAAFLKKVLQRDQTIRSL